MTWSGPYFALAFVFACIHRQASDAIKEDFERRHGPSEDR
jgi:hypothetical protein